MGIVTAVNFEKVLTDIAKRVGEGDSFEGTISYSRMTLGLERDELDVSVAVRVGNLEGQGGMFIIEPTKLNERGWIVGREAIAERDWRAMTGHQDELPPIPTNNEVQDADILHGGGRPHAPE